MPRAARRDGRLDSRCIQQHCTGTPRGASQPDSPEAVAAAIQKALNVRSRKKIRAQHAQADPAGFLPFILCAGGVLLAETEKAVAEWRRYIPPSEIGFFFNKMAWALLNRRVACQWPGMV